MHLNLNFILLVNLFLVSSVKISDLPELDDSSLVLSVQLETDTGKRGDNETAGDRYRWER